MKRRKSRLLVASVLVLLMASLIGGAIGKYLTTVSVPGKVTFTATLAENMLLQEHKADRNLDGSYSLTDQIATADLKGNYNSYELLPGLDIPKDPYIKIINKTPIEAYLFVEVVENGDVGTENEVITYTMDSNWLKLSGLTGKHKGTVYVYKGDGTSEKKLDDSIGADWTVNILAPLAKDKPETIRVSQKLITAESTGDDILTFYAAMGEADIGANPTEVYKTIYNMT